METCASFIGASLERLKHALAGLTGQAGLHLDRPVITRALHRRLSSALRAIEIMFRRLLFLLAMQVDLPDTSKASQDRERAAGRTRRWHFILMPVARPLPDHFEPVEPRKAIPLSPAQTRTLLERFQTMAGMLEDPVPAARRMARLLTRLKRRGAMRPCCAPQSRLHRLDHELGLIASTLPGLVNQALKGWYDTS
ncbi:MAG: hypothetical protein VX593_05695 [Pseudomonadota bacterium]|nr:hypothetical protein [Pseudomonadota bacterium]